MANNEKALLELIGLAKDHIERPAWCNTVDFLTEGEKIIFNQVSVAGVKNFNDGLTNGGYINILKYVLRAAAGDYEALSRLLIDLYIDDNTLLFIKKIEAL